ncbi:MAG: hypothetical protein EAX86_09435 [Candidatus Heimdallarchaeota archaeon]|nr:hypothetical protein [Candidatus Heimdallarchaeota archaeon]
MVSEVIIFPIIFFIIWYFFLFRGESLSALYRTYFVSSAKLNSKFTHGEFVSQVEFPTWVKSYFVSEIILLSVALMSCYFILELIAEFTTSLLIAFLFSELVVGFFIRRFFFPKHRNQLLLTKKWMIHRKDGLEILFPLYSATGFFVDAKFLEKVRTSSSSFLLPLTIESETKHLQVNLRYKEVLQLKTFLLQLGLAELAHLASRSCMNQSHWIWDLSPTWVEDGEVSIQSYVTRRTGKLIHYCEAHPLGFSDS